ncbi:MAG: phenylacetate--CoA ligase family protein [Desulfobacterales bacterium]
MTGKTDILNVNPQELRQMQLERLQSTLNRAYRNVPFHRNRQNEIARQTGRDPSIIENLGDIARLPFMKRSHLGEHYPYGLFAVPLRDIVRIHTAPGTTLHPTVTGYTRQDLGIWREMLARALTAGGLTSQDILQISLDPGLANWGRDYKDGAESLDIAVIPNTPLSPEKQMMLIRDYKISVLVTTPSEAAQLADRMFTADLNPTSLNLTHLILVGEPAEHELRNRLEQQLHVTTWMHYGLSEVPGPAIAFECPAHEGLHIHEDHFLPEIIDPISGEVLPSGESGELVLTTLMTRAFPLIRFRTGDRARFRKGRCACGSSLVRMDWLEGRTDDILNVNGVKVHRNQVLHAVKRILGFVPDFQHSVISRYGEKNWLEIRICMDDRLFSDEIKGIEQQIHTLTDQLRENLGVPLAVRLREKPLRTS